MKNSKIYLAATLFSLLTFNASTGYAEETKPYQYANNYAEYSLTLPEAPLAKTLWGDVDKIPYLDNPPKAGFVGESATYITTDPETDETFGVEITFLKADKDFINSLNEEKLMGFIERDLSAYKNMENKSKKFKASETDGTKQGSISGVIINTENKPIFRAEHFLTGSASIMVIKVRYNLENKKMNEYYKTLVSSIKYLPL